MSKRPFGRPKTRCENDVLEDIKNIDIRNWKKVEQYRLMVGRKWLSKPELYIGCSALEEEQEEEEDDDDDEEEGEEE